jgi:energy-coupling factor transporter ATP-binding protein EcfA2
MLSFVLNYGTEPLVLDQPEDDLDTALITKLVVPQIRRSRWNRQVIIVTHHANIPVNGDAEQVIVLTNDGRNIQVKNSPDPADPAREVLHAGPIEIGVVREDIQEILEGGKEAFQARERRYNNDLNPLHEAKRELMSKGGADR